MTRAGRGVWRRRIGGATAGLAVGLALLLVAATGETQDLVADLSDHQIAINTGFTGTNAVLFGAIEGEGDVAVVVRGPPREMVVRRMDRVAGIWINQDSMTFIDVPSFYMVAANRPVEAFAAPPALERQGIGLHYLRLQPADPTLRADPERLAAFSAALIRSQQREGLYGTTLGQVAFLGRRLFRTTVHFPANVPTGYYTVSIMLFRGGEAISAQTTPLIVNKISVIAEISDFARRHAAAYGMIGIGLAVAAGWFAGFVFRRV